MPKKFRVFIDTSALIAGLNSPTGVAGVILTACFSGKILAVISPQIIEEMENNIPIKFPKLADAWASIAISHSHARRISQQIFKINRALLFTRVFGIIEKEILKEVHRDPATAQIRGGGFA